MKLAQTAAATLVSTIGLGAPSLYVTHFVTKETIWRQVVEDALPTGNGAGVDKSTWDALADKLKTLTVKDEKLQTIKDDSSESQEKGQKVKEWCAQSYRQIYGSWVKIKETDLLEDIKNICIRKIEEQLGDKKMNLQSGTDQNHFQQKIKELKEVAEDKTSDLDVSLKKIKSKSTSSGGEHSNWRDLQKWCKNSYERGYQGRNSKRWKLVNKYCISDSQNSKSSK